MSRTNEIDTRNAPELRLTDEHLSLLAGEAGEAAAMCMRIVIKVARLRGAEQLVPIASAHLDGCLSHGQASLDFVERIVDGGVKVTVPTTPERRLP